MQAALAAKDAEMEAALAAKDAEMEAALAAKEEEMEAALAAKDAENQAVLAAKDAEMQAALAHLRQQLEHEQSVKVVALETEVRVLRERPAQCTTVNNFHMGTFDADTDL